jgi:MATE family multidrug resistance protein
MRLCGVYYNQARIMVTILFIPMFVLFLYSDHIFAALGFDPLICMYAKEVLLYKSPYLYFYSIFDATKRLLYNVGHSSLPMYIQVGTTMVHPLWCYLSLHYFEMGVKGPALAQSISTILNIAILSVCLSRISEFKEVFFMPNRECLKGISNYFKLGVPSLLLIWFEWCAFEFLTFMSGYLDVASTGAQIILFNF